VKNNKRKLLPRKFLATSEKRNAEGKKKWSKKAKLGKAARGLITHPLVTSAQVKKGGTEEVKMIGTGDEKKVDPEAPLRPEIRRGSLGV